MANAALHLCLPSSVPKRRRVQAACRSCVLCQIITPVPEDLRTTNTLSLEWLRRPSAPMAAHLHRLPEPLVSVAGRLSALTQAVSYHVTPRADMQPLGNRGNAALGSYVLLLCLVCGVKKIGSTDGMPASQACGVSA